MRIQHNIMAMSAYRNYNTNTSALSKNLEKLSSGYKINRAGDDAAGLAISEKMRAQITGLSAAQKNVKDGISLVKTAEGAMQEVQDMLNRMDYLATQSANGTYDNEVDRANLQKEVDALKEEINRIADSANFNGIKLLDGSLDGAAKAATKEQVKSVDIPEVGETPGADTILHNDGISPPQGTSFSVDLHEVKMGGEKGDKLSITIGEGNDATTIELEVTAIGGDLTAGDIIGVLTGATGAPTNVSVTVNGDPFTVGTDTLQIKGTDITLSNGENGRLTFQQTNVPQTKDEEINGSMKVSVTATPAGDAPTLDAPTTSTVTRTDGTGAAPEKVEFDLAGLDVDAPCTLNIKVIGKTYKIDVTQADIDAVADAANPKPIDEMVAGKLKDLIEADNLTDTSAGKYTVAVDGTTKSKITLTGENNAKADNQLSNDAIIVTATVSGAATNPGQYNTQTTDVKNVTVADKASLASTVFKLDEKMVADGNSITIGNVDYTFSVDEADKGNTGNKVYIGDMVGEGKTIDMEEVARRISESASGNETWTVSAHADRKGLTLVEKTNADGDATGNGVATENLADQKLDLTTVEGIKATLGFKIGAKAAVEADDSKALTLQIGDTSDSFNQMKVRVGDMHTSGMGIEDIDISTQEGAAAAIGTIKDAINYVSGIRGDLGAVQNRLEHTGNNLSVMAENIQDAESTIRDTDVAEEMMGYVKNNILVQSAQAMLAQANQVPQGVLQLLG